MISENQHLTRQMDLIPLAVLNCPINIIGAGAVGSFTALALAKMGFKNILVFDDDRIDIENMNCQFFRFSDIGKFKVDALKELIKDFTNQEIDIIPTKWEGFSLDGITICAVDSMKVRKNVYDTYFMKAHKSSLVIDPRMGAETAMLFSYNPLKQKDGDSYSKTLYSDEDAVQERCTAKSTIYCVLGLSSLICTTVKNFLVEEIYRSQILFDVKTFDMV